MKKVILIFAVSFIFGASVAFAQEEEIKQSGIEFSRIAPVGTVINSMIPPIQFRLYAGANWVPADGRKITERSLYAKLTAKDHVPDLRGMFLRSLNSFENGVVRNDGLQDPEDHFQDQSRNRIAGDYQEDELGSHTHNQKTDRHHPANRQAGFRYAGIDGSKAIYENESNMLENTGGAESRPRNVAIYRYIKIN